MMFNNFFKKVKKCTPPHAAGYSIQIKRLSYYTIYREKEIFTSIIIAIDVANCFYFRQTFRIGGIKANDLINNIFKLI
jgi:hypothetical protein